METKDNVFKRLWLISIREWKRLTSRTLYPFTMLMIPLMLGGFFASLMKEGLPHDIPIGVVDLDNTHITQMARRSLTSFSNSEVVANYPSVNEARKAMKDLDIYGFIYIPRNFSGDIMANKKTKLSYYTNQAYMIPGALVYKDLKTFSSLASAAATREFMKAKGKTEEDYMPILNPISVDFHALKNPWISYSIYLCNTMVPGLLILLITLLTVYAYSSELKENTAPELLEMSHDNIFVALTGKFLPHLIIWSLVLVTYNLYLYGVLHFPCNSGFTPMFWLSILTAFASIGFGLFMVGCLRTMRYGMSFASLWGVLALSITGLSFPIESMNPMLQTLAQLFPLKHYLMIYYNQALNGYELMYSTTAFLALFCFVTLPFIVLRPLKTILKNNLYQP